METAICDGFNKREHLLQKKQQFSILVAQRTFREVGGKIERVLKPLQKVPGSHAATQTDSFGNVTSREIEE